MHGNGKVSIFGFFLGLCGYAFAATVEFYDLVTLGQNEIEPVYKSFVSLVIFGVVIVVFVLILAKSRSWSDARTRKKPSDKRSQDDFTGVLFLSSFLGLIFSVGLILIKDNKWWESPFGLYLCTLSFFHYSEYLATAITSPTTLSTDSFLINHSTAYTIAALASWIEFGAELYFFPAIKRVHFVLISGLILCISGEILRKVAMITAMENFTHIIRTEYVEGHRLITNGVFRICRHPSYAGWFWWSVGTQILLMNPICSIGYTLASWNFFCYRITYEEATLYSFFGQDYVRYQGCVPRTGIPFVTGYTRKKKSTE